ncbi:hypothetical protein HELRODRAFT_79614 [Helobdella robusta]|uniref:Small ribosomal subunit protein uS5m n=1 Tax=Helobdella robusta TaxID=6412 RepID=T1G3Q9_HELRO|nr:hypothetical protein HELRODRAFT_79614 [Helobdella robusta]ESO03920.1 hypothetical protein HELRODRAFT_79614 [Helobdella robusta]
MHLTLLRNNLLILKTLSIIYSLPVPASDLWEGVVSVSNAGKKKGRGKRVGRKKVTDLNRGQTIGAGRENMLWPGLNSPILKGKAIVSRQKLPPDPEKAQEIVRMRDQMSKVRYPALPPLLRGYSGSKFNGQSVGPPDPVADYTFDDFDTRVLEFKTVCNMTGTLGRKMRFSAFVVTGNKNGVAGYGLGKALNAKAAIRVAKNKAAQKLVYVPRFEDHTVYHNMFAQYHRSKIFIHKKERGYGLRCHRVLKTICDLLGIKDLHCKVENSTKNVQSVTRAFFDAVTHQETHAELAERMGYHVVEMKKEEDYFPRLIASPSTPANKKPIEDEVEDLEVCACHALIVEAFSLCF